MNAVLRVVRAIGALIEPIVVFAAATITSGWALDQPFAARWTSQFGEEATLLALRWAPLILLALLIDLVLRRRGLGAWGVFVEWRAPMASFASLSMLLMLGGVPALALALVMPATPDAISGATLAFIVGLVTPIVGQELFVAGYTQRRFSDAFGRLFVAVLIALLFVLAHAQHASGGPLGWAFLGAMAVQGAVWSLARSSGAPLPLLMLAHLLLLVGYFEPRIAIAGIAVLSVLTFRGWPASFRAIFNPSVTERAP